MSLSSVQKSTATMVRLSVCHFVQEKYINAVTFCHFPLKSPVIICISHRPLSNLQSPVYADIESSGTDNNMTDGKKQSVCICKRQNERNVVSTEIPSAPLGFNRKSCHHNNWGSTTKQTTRNMAQHNHLSHTYTNICLTTCMDGVQLCWGFSLLFTAAAPTFTAVHTDSLEMSAHILWISGSFALLSVILAIYIFRYMRHSLGFLLYNKFGYEANYSQWIQFLSFSLGSDFKRQQNIWVNVSHFRHKGVFISKLQKLSFISKCGDSPQHLPSTPVAPEGQALVTFGPPCNKANSQEEEENEEECVNESIGTADFNNTSYFFLQQ